MRCPPLIALALAAALLPGTGCNLVANENPSNAPVKVTTGPTHYALFERQRVEVLEDELDVLLAQTIADAQALLDQLEADLASLDVPERFSTNDRMLRSWHETEWRDYRASVDGLYDTALARLLQLHVSAIAQAVSRAEDLVGKRSPLDDGPTGSTLVDHAITSFGETLRAEVPVQELETRAEHDSLGRIELIHVFSTFTAPGADEVIGGRLILFVGGDEHATAPHVKLVLKGADDEAPKGIRVLQAIRHRLFRGHAMVQDLGWQPMPRGPKTSFHDSALIIDNIEPRLDTQAPAFSELGGMRVLSDMQTVLVKDNEVLGGVDWRIEYRITVRGAVSWRLSEVPQFSPICAEAVGAFQ